MNNIIALGLALLTVTVNGLIGHFFAPNGIMLTPVVLTITTYLVCFKTRNIKVLLISILAFLFVAINDISIKLYSGGKHDNEGLGWIHLFLLAGLVPTLGILLTVVFKRKDERLTSKITSMIVFVGLIIGHLQLFRSLGIGRYY